jgi:hypothetical protein
MCLCFPECQACFHSVCIAYSGKHPCQRNNDIPTPTLNKSKVSVTIYSIILLEIK